MPKKTDLDPGFVARVAAGVRYAVQGVAPGDWFGPSQPSAPLAPPEVAGRQFDFPVGFNSGITPRSYEPVGFGQLRAMADGYDLMRLIIETRKDQIERLSFDVRRVDGAAGDPRVARVRALLKRPDRLHSWQQWLRMVLEDLLVIDAPAVYLRRANDGGMFAFEVIDGATIAPKIDQSGRVPLEGPAYQQVLKGVPAVDYNTDELVYFPRNPRPNRVYGFGPVEQVLTTVTIALRRQVQQLNNFTDGNLPEAYATVPESWTADQIRQFQINFDGYMAGNSANKSKLYFLPHGVVPQTLRDNPLKDGFDDWLARIVCFAFSVSPQALQPAMNKASAEQASGEAMKEGLEPLQIWVRDFVNECILRGFGYDDIEFVWTEETAINPAAQAEINTTYLKAGIKTVNEVRGEIGLPHVAEGDQLLVYGASGAVRLAEVVRKLDLGVAPEGSNRFGKVNDNVCEEPRDDHGCWTASGYSTSKTPEQILADAKAAGGWLHPPKGQYSPGNEKQCVSLVRAAIPDLPRASLWRQGAVITGPGQPAIEPGTAIATFDKNGKYPMGTKDRHHAAIFLEYGTKEDDPGIWVLNQGGREPVEKTFFPFSHRNTPHGHQASEFSVIKNPKK